MIVKRVELENFRIHERYVLSCEKQTTLIVGENGIGKTSILEAIYLAMRGKSFKASDKEMLKRGKDYYRVDLECRDREKIVIGYEDLKKSKWFEVGGRRTARIPKEVKYPVVLFVPEDLHLVATSPTKKREYFDKIFAQLDEKYHNSLLKFQKVLKQRNELLKQDNLKKGDLFSWNVLMARYGAEIWQKRRKYLKRINLDFSQVYKTIADTGDKLKLELDDDVMNESKYLANLERNFERDKVVGSTGFGVHRDCYRFVFNEVEAWGSASRGEVRSMILALKFIEAKMMQEFTGFKPLVLLDDVFSELDDNRQRCLVQNFSEHQIILTSVNEVMC